MKGFISDPVLIILLLATFTFVGLTIFISLHNPNDGQTFQLLGNLSTGFAGAVLGRVKPQAAHETAPGTTGITKTETSTVQVTPPVDK